MNMVDENKVSLKSLEQYRVLYTEIDAIDQQIKSLYNTYHSPSFQTVGSFTCGRRSPVEQALKKIYELEEIYSDKIKELRTQAKTIEEWITNLNDPFLKSCIRYHYMLGYSWKETSRKVYGYDNYYNARKVVYRYFGRE